MRFKDIVVFGTGQLGEVAWYYLTHFSPYRIVAYTVEEDFLDRDTFRNRPVVPFEEVEKFYPPSGYQLMAFISYQGVNKLRERVYQEAKKRGYDLPSFIHPDACVYTPDIGKNCFIMEQNTIQPFVRVGDNVVVWSNNHIGHHTMIGDHTFIASEVCISGGVTIGERCFLGVNATIRDNVSIGDDCVIGAGAVVMKDLEAGSVIVPVRSVTLDKKSHEVGL